jgi:transposase
MRTLQLQFPDTALPTLETVLKETKEVRVFRRAQAVREVVKGQRLQNVSDALQFTYSALRKWVHRFAHQGVQGFVDRPRPGRPAKVTCALEKHLNHLVDQDPLEHGSLSSQWSCRELATVLAQQTGVHLGRESVRCVLKKTRSATAAPPDGSIPTPLTSPMVRWNLPPWSTGRAVARSFCSMKTKPFCGALPCPARAGGAKHSGLASLYAP